MMVSSKKRTIKAGELGFTKYLVANDIPHQALISKIQFLDQIKTKNSDYLRFVLRYAVYTNPHLAAERDALIACQNPSASWHEATQGAYPPDFDPRTLERIVLGCRLRHVGRHRDQKEQRCPAGTDAQGFLGGPSGRRNRAVTRYCC